MDKNKAKEFLKKTWHFIWEDDSIWSWVVNIALAFLLIKFLVYPGLGLLFGTNFPIVAVVSGSMEHDGSFDDFWGSQGSFYEQRGITKEEFKTFSFKNGFNKGDIMILVGAKPDKVELGNVIVFTAPTRKDPIIHRVINVYEDSRGNTLYTTKGDHNTDIHSGISEDKISTDRLLGKAVLRIPFLGWIKIGAVEIFNLFKALAS